MEFSVWFDLSKKTKEVVPWSVIPLTGPDTTLWDAIKNFPLDSPGASMPFSARLARDHLWLPTYAEKVVREYRRFLYLVATEREMVTPSEDVDEAWHLHLAYTQSYWDELCGKVLGRPLHHNPTEGEEQIDSFRKAYERTLSRYYTVFQEAPPSDVWPSGADRFALGGGFRTVPLRDFRLVGRLTAVRVAKVLRYLAAALFFALPFALLGLAAFPVPFVIIGGVIIGSFLGGTILHLLADVSLPPWGKKGLGYTKYRNEPDTSGGGGCGGCGGCG